MSIDVAVISTTLEGLDEQYRTITHNLANASTVGYKRRFTVFAQSLKEQLSMMDESSSEGVESVFGATVIDFAQGAPVQTGRPLDVAISGKGFFVIETPDGPLYTRNGVFRTNAAGQLVDSVGRTVSGKNGPIVIPPTVSPEQLEITRDGSIAAAGLPIGQFKVVDFEDISILVPVGNNCFKAPDDAEPQESETALVDQGYQESSNVNIVEELVSLITVSRTYEANLKSRDLQSDGSESLLQVALS